MRLTTSAFKHGLAEEEIISALDNPIYRAEINDDPLKVLVVGVGSSFHSIEVLYTIDDTTGEIIIFHAMPTTRATFNKTRKKRK